jgi:uncharacterized protein YdhG (YjbR/CyaY superfamily)
MALAGLTRRAVASLAGSLVLMPIQVAQAYGGQLLQAAPPILSLSPFRLAGWADRPIVVSNCLGAAPLAWRAGAVARPRRACATERFVTSASERARAPADEMTSREHRSRPARKGGKQTWTMKLIDDYLARLPADKRAALERLPAQIRSLAPQATEAISYGMPAFRLGECYFAGLGATKQACSLYIGRVPVQACANDQTGYRVWKGTVNFAADRPLQDELVAKLVRSRLAEYEPV